MTRSNTEVRRVPVVGYLVLDPEPHLVAQQCMTCHERYFDRRDGCANCFATGFVQVAIPNEGKLVTFTIVARARPGVQAPYVAGIVDCGGTWVRANLRQVEPDPARLALGMPVRLVTYSLGFDTSGAEAIGFGYRPASSPAQGDRS